VAPTTLGFETVPAFPQRMAQDDRAIAAALIFTHCEGSPAGGNTRIAKY